MELVRFIFSSFWIFLGSLFLLLVIFQGITEIVKAFGYVIKSFKSDSKECNCDDEDFSEAEYEVINEED